MALHHVGTRMLRNPIQPWIKILLALLADGPKPLNELKNELKMPAATIYQNIMFLMTKNYIVSIDDDRVTITEEGKKKLQEVLAPLIPYICKLTSQTPS